MIENRRIVARTQGRRHGPITRVVSPSDLGERIKPFVFLDWFDAPPVGKLEGGIHPHSGHRHHHRSPPGRPPLRRHDR